MKNFLNLLSLSLTALVLSSCGKTTMIRSSPDYAHSLVKAQNIVSLPPMVEVNVVDAGGKHVRQHDYESQLEQHVTEVLVEKLRAKGYKVRALNRRDVHELKVSRKVLAFEEEYKRNMSVLYNPLLMDEKKAFATESVLGVELLEFQEATKADIAIFVEYFAKNKTSGSLAKDVVFSMFLGSMAGGNSIEDSAEFISMRVGLVDVINHKLLWSNVVREGYGAFSSAMSNMSSLEKADKKRLNQLLNVLFEKLPKR